MMMTDIFDWFNRRGRESTVILVGLPGVNVKVYD